MKIAIEFKDLLIERALELFLKEHLVLKKDCDFLITDCKVQSSKPLFIISNDSPYLKIPFSKEALIKALSEFDNALKQNAKELSEAKKRELEAKIDALANEFRKDYERQLDAAILGLKERLVKVLMNE